MTEMEMVRLAGRVVRVARGMIRNPDDAYDIGMDVTAEFIERGIVPVGIRSIRWRIMDRIRAIRRREEIEREVRELTRALGRGTAEVVDGRIDIEEAIDNAGLGELELRILYKRFYRGMTLDRIAREEELGRERVGRIVDRIVTRIRESLNGA